MPLSGTDTDRSTKGVLPRERFRGMPKTTAAPLDRLLHHPHIVNIRGNSEPDAPTLRTGAGAAPAPDEKKPRRSAEAAELRLLRSLRRRPASARPPGAPSRRRTPLRLRNGPEEVSSLRSPLTMAPSRRPARMQKSTHGTAAEALSPHYPKGESVKGGNPPFHNQKARIGTRRRPTQPAMAATPSAPPAAAGVPIPGAQRRALR